MEFSVDESWLLTIYIASFILCLGVLYAQLRWEGAFVPSTEPLSLFVCAWGFPSSSCLHACMYAVCVCVCLGTGGWVPSCYSGGAG